MNRRCIAATLCILALAGCVENNRYQLSKDNAGRLVRLDTRTGEVTLIDAEKLPSIPEAAAGKDENSREDSEIAQTTLPEGGKPWPVLAMPELGDTNAGLTSYWDDGKLHYVLELYPFSKRLRLVSSGYYINPSFTLLVSNAAGDQVASTVLATKHLKHTINKIRNLEELSAEGVIPMSKEDYDSLASWQLKWNP